jgi:hypothetical protein
MKKLIMFVMVLVIATSATALKYVDDAPDFAGCTGSASVFWEFEEDGCMPTSNAADPPYYYDPDPAITPTFGSRHWDDPSTGSGWGGSYGSAAWTWSGGIYTILAEDAFTQSVPERSEQPYLRQYFQVVHTMVPDLEQPDFQNGAPIPGTGDYRWPIGLGLELWDMSADEYSPDGWTGCPVGYENLDGDGYRGGYENVPPDIHYALGGGWFKSIWVHDFSEDGTVYTSATEEEFEALFEATHTACIIGMDFDPLLGEIFQIEEASLDFIWFTNPDRTDIPSTICYRPGQKAPPIVYSTTDLPIYEPMDIQVEGPPAINGPAPMGPVSGQINLQLAWRPSHMVGDVETDYTEFEVTVVFDPEPNSLVSGNAEFDVTEINGVPVVVGYEDDIDPNQHVTLTFTEADFIGGVFDPCDIQSITVEAKQDTDIEGNETRTSNLTVTIDVDDPNFGSDPCKPVSVDKRLVVVDNDTPFIAATPFEFDLAEKDAPNTSCFDVRLSHLPADGATVYVYVDLSAPDPVVIDPNFEQYPPETKLNEPNRLTFTATNWEDPDPCTMTSGWHMGQTICLSVNDDDELQAEEARWYEGEITLTPFSKGDMRYLVETLNPDGTSVVQDPCVVGVEISDGVGVATTLDIKVEDNDCGARGYNPADIAGGGEEGDEPDCIVGLADIFGMINQWTLCTYPYDGSDPAQYKAKTWDECNPLWTWMELLGYGLGWNC